MKQKNANQITWRSIILGILLSLPHGFFSIQTYTPTTVSLIYTVVLTILLLVLVNILIKRQAPKIAFSQAELLTIYTMLSLSVAISGTDVLQVLVPIIGHAFWFASPGKRLGRTVFAPSASLAGCQRSANPGGALCWRIHVLPGGKSEGMADSGLLVVSPVVRINARYDWAKHPYQSAVDPK